MADSCTMEMDLDDGLISADGNDPVQGQSQTQTSSTVPPASSSEPVTDGYLNKIVVNLPSANYSKICDQLGWGENRAQNELDKHSKDYTKAYRAVLQDWMNRDARTKPQLIDLLKKAGYNLPTKQEMVAPLKVAGNNLQQ